MMGGSTLTEGRMTTWTPIRTDRIIPRTRGLRLRIRGRRRPPLPLPETARRRPGRSDSTRVGYASPSRGRWTDHGEHGPIITPNAWAWPLTMMPNVNIYTPGMTTTTLYAGS